VSAPRQPIRETTAMIASMAPVAGEEDVVFCATTRWR
jgi:hypothetical protein